LSTPEITLEIRWFLPGIIPEKEVGNWFFHNPRFGARLIEKDGKKREDLYLLTPGNAGIGPKLREGKFEIKLLRGSQEVMEPGGAAGGRGEVWHKWKWPYARGKKDKKIDQLITESLLAGTREKLRVMVGKQRWQRKFRVAGPGELAPVAGSRKDLPWWVSAELTAIAVKGAPWWTLAVEICENPEASPLLLQQCLTWMLQDYAGPPLRVANSCSYPEWLAVL